MPLNGGDTVMGNRDVKESLGNAIMSLLAVCIFLPLLEILDRLDF